MYDHAEYEKMCHAEYNEEQRQNLTKGHWDSAVRLANGSERSN